MFGKIMLGLVVVDIIILYAVAFAGRWFYGLFGGDVATILFAGAIGSMFVCLGVAGATQPVIIKNTDEVAKRFAAELEDMKRRGR